MFGKNPFNEYRATQQQVQEKTVDEAAFTKKAVETGKVKTGPSKDRMAAMQKQYDDKKKNEATQYIIPEEIPANERTAFHGAAAAAAKAGKKSFNFGGKTHPVTMKKDTAKAIADDNVKEGMYKDMDTEKSEPSPRSDAKVKADMKKRRKTEKSDVDINPKLDKGTKDNSMEQKESTGIREKLMAVLEGDRAKHYKGAMKPETPEDKLSGKGAKDMMEPAKNAKVDDTEEKGHIDAVKAAKTGPQAKARSGGDNISKGDKKIVQGGTPVKGQMYKTMEAYASIYEQSVTTTHDVTGDIDDKKGVMNYVKKKAGGPVTVKHRGITPNGDHEISVTGHPKHVMKFVNHHEGGKYSHDKEGHAQYKKDFD